ncbi:MAG TPA: ABC transporter ATP-binding protein [Candidatus Saccharimonadales bacterium]|nr:ABC transporter ATP-binding protein [Candidatus Saccharimonadales bacterium]
MATYKDTLQIYWQHTRRRWPFLAWFYIFMPFAILAENFAIPYIGSQVIDKLTKHPHGPFNIFVPLLLAGVSVGIFTVVSWRFVSRRQWASNITISNDLSQTVFDHLIAQSDRFHADKFGGALVAAANRFSGAFSGLSDSIAYSLYGLLLSYIFTIIILWPKAPEFVIGLVLVSIGYAFIMYKLRMREIPYNEASAAAGSAQNAQLADTITNAMTVRSFGQEAYEHDLFAKRLRTTKKRGLSLMRITTTNEYVSASFTQIMNIAALTAGIVAVLSFHASIGIVLLLISYTGNIVGRLWDLQFTIKNINNSLGNAQEMTALLKKKPEVRDTENPEKLKIKDGSIEFRDVTFGYKDSKGVKLFKNLNLTIAPGEHIGLVGGSGSGKTTLTKLLLRFNDVDGGDILIDGQNIAHVNQSELRQSIAYVPQEPMLFHRTLLENIKYGKPDASFTSLERAAKHARVDDFAKHLPRGYETIVGERGTKLSGGQRQRIAIARAILKDSPIMIMDEATSALDSHSEKMIQEALKDLMDGRTAIVVAHRLSTIMELDRIVVMDKGRIIEQGSHHQLLEKGGYYAKLWHHQSRGFLDEEKKKPSQSNN